MQAEVIQDLLVNDIDYLRAVRGVLKEIFRLIAKDIDFVVFCRSLTRSRLEAMFTDADPAIKVCVQWCMTGSLFKFIFKYFR